MLMPHVRTFPTALIAPTVPMVLIAPTVPMVLTAPMVLMEITVVVADGVNSRLHFERD